ncbi:hypothetical protein [Gulosibacter chungangensis]|uniref:Uncharacterized protein n=1 Tax=Gulosibacter chungangensis TaxID=979746 RepID=A0A7J5BA96_9MICO|nr:hypothetical protein [Gulosibacter chungangensis]KAB1641155.1 hypothetical protein F8O05_13050 [Gulosibacter chungangensis]
MRILLAVDFDIEARLLEGILVSGHEVVDRVTGGDSLIESVTRNRPDIVLAQGGPETLTARSLAACDAAGSRIFVLMADEVERKNALALGVVDRLDAQLEWPELESLLNASNPARHERERDSGHDDSSAGTGRLSTGQPHLGAHSTDITASRVTSHPEPNNGTEPILSRRERKLQERNESKRKEGKRRKSTGKEKTGIGAWRKKSSDRDIEQADANVPQTGGAQPMGTASATADRATGSATHGEPPATSRKGEVIAVWGPYGAPGRTSLAIALAASFANRQARVVLIDADPYGGAVAQLLGITDESPGLAAACRLAGAGALNSLEFERIASQVKTLSNSFLVLGGIVNPERWPELSRSRMRGVLEQATLQADIVIVDVGFNLERDEELVSDVAAPRRNAATHTVLEYSDTVIALAEATPLGIQRYLRARLHLLESVGAKCHIEAVANKVRGSVSGVDAGAQIRQVLRRFGGIEQVTLLPNDPKACDRAIGGALSIVDASPRSQLSRQIGALADRISARPEHTDSQSLVGLSRVEHHQPYSAL